MSNSFPKFGKFSAIISLNKLSTPFPLSSLSNTINLVFVFLIESDSSQSFFTF